MALRQVLGSTTTEQMRKRSKYRPKPVLVNPVGYVIESLTPVSKHGSMLTDLRIGNHAAMASLTQGKAVKSDIDTLIQAVNMTEAIYRLGFGAEYNELIVRGLAALRAVGSRGANTGKFILRAEEMTALNEIMELHDAQLEAVTLKDMEKAIEIVRKDLASGKATPITS